MILLQAQLMVASSDRARFLELMHELVRTSRQEAGCLAFRCFEDTLEANTFVVFEEWEDRESLDRHESSQHLAEFKRQAAPYYVARAPSRVWDVDHTGTLGL